MDPNLLSAIVTSVASSAGTAGVAITAIYMQNTRIDELKETLRAEIGSLREETRGEFRTLRAEMASFTTEIRGEIRLLSSKMGGLRDHIDDAIKLHEAMSVHSKPQ